MSVTVIKVGGSLLSLPDLGERLQRLLHCLEGERVLLVAGGGPAADVVREWDQLHALGPERSHWLAIDSLSLTARLLSQLLPNADVVRTRTHAEAGWQSDQVPILEPRPWLELFERERGAELPRDWTVTTDSIAGWLTVCWPAQRLILAKSVAVPSSDAADAVDEHFPQLLPRLPRIEWINLRDESAQLVPWNPEI